MADILVIDDKADIRKLVSEVLQEELSYTVACAADVRSALDQLTNNPKIVILDIWLESSDMDGIGLLKVIKQRLPKTQVIMISGHGNIDVAVKTIKLGAYDFIEKPFKTAKLLIMVERAIEKYLLLNENKVLKEHKTELELIGQSKQMLKLKSLIESIANKSNSRVIITGPNGVGKKTIAQIIHNRSVRYAKPFVYWHITNKSLELLSKELFGDKNISSVFVKADGGTLFINDFLHLPLEMQASLLQALKNSTVANYHFDVRVIAATKGVPEQALQDNTLSEALYYNLNIGRIDIPGLSQRKDDIELLLNYFIRLTLESNGSGTLLLGQDVVRVMKSYDWPGNVRQLKNAVEWMTIVASSQNKKEISLEMLPGELIAVDKNNYQALVDSNALIFEKPIKDAREFFEKQYIEFQLERFNNNISKTAEFIGMDRAALHRKIKLLQN